LQLKPTMLMLRMITLAAAFTPTCPLRVGFVPEQPMIVLFEPIVAVPWPRLPLTKITAGVVPLASVLNCDSVGTSCPPAVPPPVVLPFKDAHPIGAGAPEMNDGTAQGVAACVASVSSGGSDPSDRSQPTKVMAAEIMKQPQIDFARVIGTLLSMLTAPAEPQ